MNQFIGNHVATIQRNLNCNRVVLETGDQIHAEILNVKYSCVDCILRLIGIQLNDFVQEILKRRKSELMTFANDLLKRVSYLQMRFQGFFIHLFSNFLNIHSTQEIGQKLKIKKIFFVELRVVK